MHLNDVGSRTLSARDHLVFRRHPSGLRRVTLGFDYLEVGDGVVDLNNHFPP